MQLFLKKCALVHDSPAVNEMNTTRFTLTGLSAMAHDTARHRQISTNGEKTTSNTKAKHPCAVQFHSTGHRKKGEIVDHRLTKYFKPRHSLSDLTWNPQQHEKTVYHCKDHLTLPLWQQYKQKSHLLSRFLSFLPLGMHRIVATSPADHVPDICLLAEQKADRKPDRSVSSLLFTTLHRR